jgi:hypothetical protein
MVIDLVDHASKTVSLNKNPFNFQHINAEYVALCQGGRQVPAKAFQPQFNNKHICARILQSIPGYRDESKRSLFTY